MNSADTVRPAPVAGQADERLSEHMQPVGPAALLWLPVATLIVGLAVTAALVIVSHSQYTSNESRLLKLRVRDAAALVTEAVPSIETPLVSAAELADATSGNVAKFKNLVAPDLLTGSAHQYVSVSLWKISDPAAGPVAVAGASPALAAHPATARAFLARAAHSPTLSVIGFLQPPSLRLGYAFATPAVPNGYVAYGESPLPASRRSRLQSTSAFAGLDYALYLGPTQTPRNLLLTDLVHPPRRLGDAETVPFGDQQVTLAMSSRTALAGSLPRQLPWIIAVLGALLSIAAAALTWRLTQRRHRAEELAAHLEVSASENSRLYAEQRTIAQTLQHALLPDRLPQVPGIQASARYEAGEQGVDVGGDWYDVIDLEDGRVLLVVGDVSGRGLPAATTMASLRFAIRAYAAQSDPPEEILTKLSHLVSVADSGQLATVLCAMVDIGRGEITVTSAGHLPLLLIADGNGTYIKSEVGLPIGVESGYEYTSTTVAAPPAATVVAFTDGLVELRGESIDQGLERLRDAAVGDDAVLPELLDRLVRELPRGTSADDIAIVGVRWTR